MDDRSAGDAAISQVRYHQSNAAIGAARQIKMDAKNVVASSH